MAFEPTILHVLVGCSYHWATTETLWWARVNLLGLDWKRIARLPSQVMTDAHELTMWVFQIVTFAFIIIIIIIIIPIIIIITSILSLTLNCIII